MNKKRLASEAARTLGSISTPRKAAASARNGAATRFKSKPLEDFECTCGKCPDNPKTYCPRGRAIKRRQAPQDAAQSTLKEK